MESQTLVTEAKYKGKYVALKSFQENTVVASGKKPEQVLKRAEDKGYKMPVIVFVPQKEMTQVY